MNKHLFRILIQGDGFKFACFYHAANGNSAGKQAMLEWDNLQLIEIKRVV